MLPRGTTLPRGRSVFENGTTNERNGVMEKRKFLSRVCKANPLSDDEMEGRSERDYQPINNFLKLSCLALHKGLV